MFHPTPIRRPVQHRSTDLRNLFAPGLFVRYRTELIFGVNPLIQAGFVAKTGNPADKRQQMSGQEVETLVNALISSTKSPIGSNDVFKSEVRSASSAAERTAASIKSSDPNASEVRRSGRWRSLLEFRRRR